MHARGYLASLGTTGLLVAGAVAILIAASAFLAFEGWPGDESRDDALPVVIDPGSDDSTPSGPERVAAEAGELAGEVAFVPSADPASAGGVEAPLSGGPPVTGPGGDEPEAPGRGGGDQGPERVEPPGGPGDPGLPGDDNGPGGGDPPPAPTLTDGLADGVESATGFLGEDAVSQVSPGLGTVVTGAGELLTDIVRSLDGTPAPPRP